MFQFNVLLSVPIEIELQVDAESEEAAKVMAKQQINEAGLDALEYSDYWTIGDSQVIESWRL